MSFEWKQKIKSCIPSFLTLLNLSLGLLAISSAFIHKHEFALQCNILAASLDLFDGRLARRWHVTSKFGGNLDSLADLISFGLAPAFIFYGYYYNEYNYVYYITWDWLILNAYVIAVAWRLARFVPSESMVYFSGVPAPLGAGYALLPFFLYQANMLGQPSLMFSRIALMLSAASMVSYLEIPSGKDKKPSRLFWALFLMLAASVSYFSSFFGFLCLFLLYTLHWIIIALWRLFW